MSLHVFIIRPFGTISSQIHIANPNPSEPKRMDGKIINLIRHLRTTQQTTNVPQQPLALTSKAYFVDMALVARFTSQGAGRAERRLMGLKSMVEWPD